MTTCALTQSGGVKCWGSNLSGELGDGTFTDRLTPVDVVGLSSGVIAIALGSDHSCALTQRGGVKCWGWNKTGQLGDGTTNTSPTPVNVLGLVSGINSISAGNNHTCALTQSGEGKCWGDDEYGQLGDGATVRLTPVHVALTVTMKFLSNPDGYQFDNKPFWYFIWTSPWHPDTYDFSVDDLVRLFGKDGVCASMVNGVCHLNSLAQQWYDNALKLIDEGHCDGMSVTSLRFFAGPDQQVKFQSGVTTTYGLDFDHARRNISYFHILQETPATALAIGIAQFQTPDQVLSLLLNALSSDVKDPYVLHIYGPGGGHALVPYSLENKGNGIWWIWVYDPNYPNDASHFVIINMNDHSWSYTGTFGTWGGNASSFTMHVVRISEYKPVQTGLCPWCFPVDPIIVPIAQTSLTGGGHLLYTDKQGNQLGYIGNNYVSEIPGAWGIPAFDDVLSLHEPIYYIPLNDTYHAKLDGSNLTQTSSVSLRQFGPGYSSGVDVKLSPTSSDQIDVANDGSSISYKANSQHELSFVLADNLTKNDFYKWEIADVTSTDTGTVVVANQAGTSKLVVNNQGSGATGTYNLKIDKLSSGTEEEFVHFSIPIASTDTEYIDYGTWDGQGGITIEIDNGSNGTIDQKIVVSNQIHAEYLPIVVR